MLKLIILDVDGTLTDGGIYISSDSVETKRFYAPDGLGIIMAQRQGVRFAIITGRDSECVAIRAKELEIDQVYQRVNNKKQCLANIMELLGLSQAEVGYIGDDMNDFEAMALAGFIACPANAAKGIKSISNYIAKSTGGAGAVREIIDFILDNNYHRDV